MEVGLEGPGRRQHSGPRVVRLARGGWARAQGPEVGEAGGTHTAAGRPVRHELESPGCMAGQARPRGLGLHICKVGAAGRMNVQGRPMKGPGCPKVPLPARCYCGCLRTTLVLLSEHAAPPSGRAGTSQACLCKAPHTPVTAARSGHRTPSCEREPEWTVSVPLELKTPPSALRPTVREHLVGASGEGD